VHLSGSQKESWVVANWDGREREKKWKAQTAVCQVMATVLWDSEGIMLVEFRKRSATISSEQYVHTLKKLKLKGLAKQEDEPSPHCFLRFLI
jgi:hypothetical protein